MSTLRKKAEEIVAKYHEKDTPGVVGILDWILVLAVAAVVIQVADFWLNHCWNNTKLALSQYKSPGRIGRIVLRTHLRKELQRRNLSLGMGPNLMTSFLEVGKDLTETDLVGITQETNTYKQADEKNLKNFLGL